MLTDFGQGCQDDSLGTWIVFSIEMVLRTGYSKNKVGPSHHIKKLIQTESKTWM